MRKVEPIKDRDEVKRIKNTLSVDKSERGKRVYLLFCIGIYTGLRISDLLSLRVSDLKGREAFTIRERKTGKVQDIEIPKELQIILDDELRDETGERFIFQSRERDQRGQSKPITARQALNDLKQVAIMCDIKTPFGCHSLRKTFGYAIYKNTGDLDLVAELFKHTSTAITRRYIGLRDEDKAKARRGLRF